MHTFARRLSKVLIVAVACLATTIAGFVIFVLIAWDRPTTRAVVPMTASSDAATRARGKYPDSRRRPGHPRLVGVASAILSLT